MSHLYFLFMSFPFFSLELRDGGPFCSSSLQMLHGLDDLCLLQVFDCFFPTADENICSLALEIDKKNGPPGLAFGRFFLFKPFFSRGATS